MDNEFENTHEEEEVEEQVEGGVGDVTAQVFSIRMGGARDVNAESVNITQGGARNVKGATVTLRQAGAQSITAENVVIRQGGGIKGASGSPGNGPGRHRFCQDRSSQPHRIEGGGCPGWG